MGMFDNVKSKDGHLYQTKRLVCACEWFVEGEAVRDYNGSPETDQLFEMYDEKKPYVVALGVIKGGVLVEVLRSPDIPSAYGYEGEALEWMEREVMRLYEKHELKPWQGHVNLS